MEYLKYSEYRQPEINSPYLIPTHWKEKKLRFIFTFGRGLGITKSDLVDEGIACVNYGEIHSKYGFEIIPEKQQLKYVVENYLESSVSSLLNNGDFVFADTSEDLEGSGNFAHLNSNIPTFAGYHTVIARPTGEHLSRFLAYFIDSSLYRSQIRKSVSGVKVFSITQAILKNSYIWLPPIDEQEKIVVFLDNKTQKIDSLIKKKKELIEKLEEQRIAVITQAVTKGIDENANLKPSGVDWLGDVPEHWQVRPLKFCCDFLNNQRIPLSAEERTGMEQNYPYYGASGIIDHVEGYIYDEPTILIAEDGANLLSRSTDLAFIATGQYWVNNHAHILNPIEGEFHFWANLLCIVDYEPWVTGSAQPKLSKENLSSVPLPYPSLKEQREISEYIKSQLSKIEPLKKKALDVVDRLTEYRSAIITSAVTGKIDVREIELPKEFQ